MLHLPALWYFHMSVICPHRFHRVRFISIPPCFVKQRYLWNIAMQPSVSCYNVRANLCCSGCSPLGEKSLWNGTIVEDLAGIGHLFQFVLVRGVICFSLSWSGGDWNGSDGYGDGHKAGIILCMCPANERWRYIVRSSPIGWGIYKMIPDKVWMYRVSIMTGLLMTWHCGEPGAHQ